MSWTSWKIFSLNWPRSGLSKAFEIEKKKCTQNKSRETKTYRKKNRKRKIYRKENSKFFTVLVWLMMQHSNGYNKSWKKNGVDLYLC